MVYAFVSDFGEGFVLADGVGGVGRIERAEGLMVGSGSVVEGGGNMMSLSAAAVGSLSSGGGGASGGRVCNGRDGSNLGRARAGSMFWSRSATGSVIVVVDIGVGSDGGGAIGGIWIGAGAWT